MEPIDRDPEIILDSESLPETKLLNTSQFIALYILTFGGYSWWWTYKTWRYFRNEKGMDVMPVMRTIFSIFFQYSLFNNVQQLAISKGYEKRYSAIGLYLLMLAITITSTMLNLSGNYDRSSGQANGAYEVFVMALSFLTMFVFIQPFNALNFCLEQNNERVVEGKFETRHYILMALGILIWIFFFVGVFGQ